MQLPTCCHPCAGSNMMVVLSQAAPLPPPTMNKWRPMAAAAPYPRGDGSDAPERHRRMSGDSTSTTSSHSCPSLPPNRYKSSGCAAKRQKSSLQ